MDIALSAESSLTTLLCFTFNLAPDEDFLKIGQGTGDQSAIIEFVFP